MKADRLHSFLLPRESVRFLFLLTISPQTRAAQRPSLTADRVASRPVHREIKNRACPVNKFPGQALFSISRVLIIHSNMRF